MDLWIDIKGFDVPAHKNLDKVGFFFFVVLFFSCVYLAFLPSLLQMSQEDDSGGLCDMVQRIWM